MTTQSIGRKLRHHFKVVVGQALDALIERQYFKGRGPFRKFVSGTSHEARNAGIKMRQVMPEMPIPRPSVSYWAESEAATRYLKLMGLGRDSTNPIMVFQGENIRVSFPTCVHKTSDGHLITEAVLSTAAFTNPKYYFELLRLDISRLKKAGNGILLGMPWNHNFYHWMLECLPRLLCLEFEPDLNSLPLLLPQSAPSFVFESLQLAGLSDRVIRLEDGVYQFDALSMISNLAATSEVSPLAIKWLNRTLKTDTQTLGPKKIYVSRRDAKIRFVSNEREVEEVMNDFGFSTVVMSDYSLAQQINLFREADHVVGPHGAGLSNLAFCKPDTTVIEFCRDGHFNGAFGRIASIQKLKYGFLVGEPTAFGGVAVAPSELSSLLYQVFKNKKN